MMPNPGSNLTASGEAFDPTQLTAAHPTLPIPSYARITNPANGRMIVVRINDRSPLATTALFRFLAQQLTVLTRQTTPKFVSIRLLSPVMVRFLVHGMACTTVAKQTYALPAPPDLSGGAGTSSVSGPQGDILPVSNSTLKAKIRPARR